MDTPQHINAEPLHDSLLKLNDTVAIVLKNYTNWYTNKDVQALQTAWDYALDAQKLLQHCVNNLRVDYDINGRA